MPPATTPTKSYIPFIVLGLVVLIGAPLAYMNWSQSENAPPQTVTLSGREIGERLVQFIEKAQRSDGSFIVAYKCEMLGTPCAPLENPRVWPSGFAIIALTLGGREESADKAMAYSLSSCKSNKTCNFNAIDFYYEKTKDQRYRAALDVAGKDALAIASSAKTLEDYVNLSQYTIPEKLARMYELSKDVRYQNALKKMGDAILKDVDFSKGREVYRQGEYGEYKDMAILASKGLPYVYKGTGDAKYEAAYMSFFETSDIVQFSPSLLNAQYLVGPVLASAEALSYLSREETDPAKAAKYENDARLMLQAVLAAHFDGSERPLWDGGNSILIRSDATPGRDEDPNSRYKATNENGRIAQLLLVSFGDTAFNLPM